ncbi:MAG: hypothetical protein V3T77_11670 [Planctomycetota bacterium]
MSLANEAEFWRLCIQVRLEPPKAAIEWAKTMLVDLDSPPEELEELPTLIQDDVKGVVSCLKALSKQENIQDVAESIYERVMIHIYQLHKENHLTGRQAARKLYQLCQSASFPSTHHQDFCHMADNNFVLAEQGFRSEESAEQEMVRYLERLAAEWNPAT